MFQRHYLLFLLLYLPLTPAYSQAFKLDSTFGNYGIVTTDIDRSDALHVIVIQSDQKILAAGRTDGVPGIGGIDDMVLVRYLPNGSLDPEFGNGGIVQIDSLEFYSPYAMAIQPDGRIVIAGRTTSLSYIDNVPFDDFFIVRFNQNGTVDNTFGENGFVITDMGGDFEWANDVLIQNDGKIVAAGFSDNRNGINSGFTMVRYTSNGEVDLSFGDGGFVWTKMQEYDEVTKGVVQPDGKIVLGGYTRDGFVSDFAMVRYLENGIIDSLFEVNGIVQTDLGEEDLMDIPTSMILEPSGKIVLGGYANFSYSPDKCEIGIVRYNSDGSLDTSFGNNGISIISLGTRSRIQAMTQQLDGKYLLTGSSNLVDSLQQWLLLRLDYTGLPDTTFGPMGVILTDIEGNKEIALSIAIQNGDEIVVGGMNNGGFEDRDFVLARYIKDTSGHTGIQELSPLSVSISPNLCTDILKVEFEGIDGFYNCMITDLSGRPIRHEKIYKGYGGNLLIDTKELTTGIYFLRISDNIKSGVVSFVVID